MFHSDGSIYSGEWRNDKENGHGVLFMANGDVYEGSWKDGRKHGDGRYHFKQRGQMLSGTWSNGTAKCGAMEAFDNASATIPFKYPIPSLELVDPDLVISDAQQIVRDSHAPPTST